MSRSQPNIDAPNPAVRWFEWNGEHGTVRYYDKDTKQNVPMALPFTFLLLDELASVRGWHDASDSGIYSNEVKDTRTGILVVKSFKAGSIAEGIYKDIKDRVNAAGGQYVANCYIAFKQNGSGLAIGSLRFKGAALGSWMEFRKNHRNDIYHKAINIVGYSEGKKGKVIFRVPTFDVKDISEATNNAAVDLDKQFQDWLDSYFSRKTGDRVAAPQQADYAVGDNMDEPTDLAPMTDDDIPFSWLLPLVGPIVGLIGLGVLFA